MSPPPAPPSWMKKYRDPTVNSVTVEALVLATQLAPATSPALSLPLTQAKGTAHVGQPVPMYSTVLLRVKPQVVTLSNPPKGTSGPKLR